MTDWLRTVYIRLAATVALALLVASGARGEPAALPIHQLRALYLFNFTRYVEWPANTFTDTNDCYTIGIAGSDDTCKDLEEIARSKTVNGKKLMVQRIARAEDAKKCQIVYLGPGTEKLTPSVLEATRKAPVLTVGEQEDFISRGGMVRFAREGDTLRLEINLDACQGAHLTISARLLPIAKVIHKPNALSGN